MKHIAIGIIALALCLPAISQASPYACSGTVSQVTSDLAGNVNASFAFQVPVTGAMEFETVCNVTAVVNAIPIDACKSIFAVLLAAHLTQSTVVLWFDNTTPNTCSMPPWSNLKAFGWYWGPALQ